jgi:HlyD family secretion protein
MHPNPKRIIPLVIIAGLAILIWWFYANRPTTSATSALAASGTIEATDVIVSPEFGGKVLEVMAQEGDVVTAGNPLVRFEDKLLQAQLQGAQAALAVAQANYDLVASGTPDEQRQLTTSTAELEITQAEQAIEDLRDTADLAAAQAQQAVAAADKQLDQATQRLDNLTAEADQADIDAARASVTLAKDQLDKAREDYQPYEKKPETNVIRAMLLAKMAAAQKKYDSAVTRLNNLLGKVNNFELALAEANKALAQAQLDEAQRQYNNVKDGPDPDVLLLAEQRLAVAKARLAVAKAGTSAEQLALAQAQIQAAQAAVEVIQAQIDKLVIHAPTTGTVLSRSVEPGEIVAPGAILMTLGNLDDLSITVYIPEDRYGTLQLGQLASLTTDSFPGQVFSSRVIDIADQAEFTPRNVQTAEGRRATVFAVKLAIEDPQNRLKPGMPADVEFK